MDQLKLNRFSKLIRRTICLVSTILLSCSAVLSVGVAYGRYCKTITGTMQFVADREQQVWTMGVRDAYDIGTEIPTAWTQAGDGTYVRTVSLCVSNSDQYGLNTLDRDVAVRIRLYLPEGTYSSSMTLALQVEGETAVYSAEAGEYLSSGSALYKENDVGGWIYTFRERSGDELVRILAGGQISDLNLTLTASEVITDLSDYKLLVDIVPSDVYPMVN